MSEKKTNSQQATELQSVSIHLDRDAILERIATHGILLEHYQSYRCPVGMSDIGDNRYPHSDHSECEDGFIYERVGTIRAVLSSNSKSKQQSDAGMYDNSGYYATFHSSYEDSEKPVYIAPFDRLYLAENDLIPGTNLDIPMWQIYRHNESGIDRLKYPIRSIQALRDNNNKVYTENVDFVLENGAIRWITNSRPQPQLGLGPGLGNGFDTDRGGICSVRYTIRPYYYVGNLQHDLRIVQIDTMEGLKAAKMPQMALLYREYIPQNKQNSETPDSSDVLRLIEAPPSGGFGPK